MENRIVYICERYQYYIFEMGVLISEERNPLVRVLWGTYRLLISYNSSNIHKAPDFYYISGLYVKKFTR